MNGCLMVRRLDGHLMVRRLDGHLWLGGWMGV